MNIFPAIDLYEKKVVRLLRGDYAHMTVYNDDPCAVAEDFKRCGAEYIHIVDLEGAKTGCTPNLEVICAVKERTGLFCEVGGGIRSEETLAVYAEAGIDRMILGTSAVSDEAFVQRAIEKYGEKIAVGADLKDGYVAIKGWTEQSALTGAEFFKRMQHIGVQTVICTDISRDGAMRGSNIELYRELYEQYSMQIIASGGVTSINDIRRLAALGLYGAIIGKAYYTGAIDLKEAIEVTK